ncbi:MAG: ParA family protein [Bdellovibrio bacteriovorus]
MRVIGVYNIKGGVGKTATAVNLAHLSAESGFRTLLWDLDPQAAATYYFRVKARVPGGVKALLGGKRGLGSSIKATDFADLDLLPAEFSLRNLDLLLEEHKGPTKRLRRLLRPEAPTYDHCLLDCPPSISLVSENVFRAADLLLVPLIPTTLSARTLDQLLDFLEGHPRHRGLRVLPFFSMVDRRRRLHRELMERLPERYPGFLPVSIPYSGEVERMGVHRLPLTAYAPSSPAAEAYRSLWAEVLAALAADPDGPSQRSP